VLRSIAVRKSLPEALRVLCGSSALLAPTDADLADDEMRRILEQAFAGGGYTVQQRAALLTAAWDHISSSLDGREHSYELFGNGGAALWRMRLRGCFDRYTALANSAQAAIGAEMPQVDLDHVRRPDARRPSGR
jgi:4-hydroxyphenylacetate 3-monooxygenase